MKIVSMQQVHGNNVVRVGIKDIGMTIPNCDALIANDSKVTLCVRVADCLPISVIDKKTHSFGLIHAGWRGLDNRIIGKSIKKMKEELKVKSEDLVIQIGPHICKDHYEVKSDVSSKFKNYPGGIYINNGKEYLDLTKIAELQLIEIGVKKENISVDSRCTFEESNLCSYRRDKNLDRNHIYLSI